MKHTVLFRHLKENLLIDINYYDFQTELFNLDKLISLHL
jgi:hypothetical protein